MPTAAPKPCLATHCGVLVRDGTSRCPSHKRDAWQRYRNDVPRISGRRLQAQRQALFQREPLCRECQRMGLVQVAVIRDHIQPLAEGGTDDDANIQPLCRACSDRKTAAEARRGRVTPPARPASPAAGGGGQILGTSSPETGPQAKFLRAQVLEKFSPGGGA